MNASKEEKHYSKQDSSGSKTSETTVLELFRSPVFYVILSSGVAGFYTQNIFFATIVDFSLDKGMSLGDVASMMTYFAVAETLGRLCLPLLADRDLVRRSTLMMLSFFMMGLSAFAIERVKTLLPLQVSCSLFGAFFGSAVTVEGVLIADYLGVRWLSLCFGITGFISVPLFMTNPLIIGKKTF